MPRFSDYVATPAPVAHDVEEAAEEGKGFSPRYPAYVLPLSVLLSLEAWAPHQELLSKGMLAEAAPGDGRVVIFVSHQWRGASHPDGDGQQLRVLQAVLRSLMDGKCCARLSLAEEFVQLGRSRGKQVPKEIQDVTSLFASDPAAIHIWLDYFSVPQPFVAASWDEEAALRARKQLAARSLKDYARAASLFLVLAPPLPLRSESDKMVNYGTWQRHGWCIMERLCWAFSGGPQSGSMLLVEGESSAVLERSFSGFLPAALGTAEWMDSEQLGSCRSVLALGDDLPKDPSDLTLLTPLLSSLLQDRLWDLRGRGADAGGDDLRDFLQVEGSLCQRIPYLMAKKSMRFVDQVGHLKMSLQAGEEHDEEAARATPLPPPSVERFLDVCAFSSLDARDGQGRVPLHLAAAIGEVAIVEGLIARGVDVGARTTKAVRGSGMPAGAGAVHFAAAWCCQEERQSREVLQALLKAACDANATASGLVTPLHLAAARNNCTMAALLLDARAELEATDRLGVSPLHAAVLHSAGEAVRLLLERRASPSASSALGGSALHLLALASSAVTVLPFLLAAGCDPNELTEGNRSSLTASTRVLTILASFAWFFGLRSRAGLLLRTARSPGGLSPLMACAVVGNVQAARALLDARADPELRNREGLDACELAAAASTLDGTANVELQEVLSGKRNSAETSWFGGGRHQRETL